MHAMVRESGTAPKQRHGPALVASAVSAALAGGKFASAWLTGSSALLASAADSTADALVSSLNGLVLWAASKPADPGHPFGHGKLEHLAGLGQALLMAGSAFFVLRSTLEAFESPRHLEDPLVGFVTAAVGIVVALAISSYLARAGKRLDSPALTADSRHYASDYITQAGIILAFACDLWFAAPLADPIVSLLIVGAIGKSAFELASSSIQALMDEKLAGDELRLIEETILKSSSAVRGFHDLMARRSGQDRFVQCHVEIDATLTFREAHAAIEAIRSALEMRLPRVQVTLHADPWPEDVLDAQTHLPHLPRKSADWPELTKNP